MTSLDELILDLRAHAHEAPTPCSALMRRAAAELSQRRPAEERGGKHRRPQEQPACS